MILEDICLLAADTSRSKAYLSSLVRYKLIPSLILLLPQNSFKNLPGNTEEINKEKIIINDQDWSETLFDTNMNIENFLISHNLNYEKMHNHNINDENNIQKINSLTQKIIIYSGYGGVLLRDGILSTKKKFLHIHGGYLPKYKGSTTNYYSIIEENIFGATSIFLNEIIDSGPIIMRKKFSIPKDLSKADHILDAGARSKVLIETLKRYLEEGEFKENIYDEDSEIFYIIHPLLKHISILRNK